MGNTIQLKRRYNRSRFWVSFPSLLLVPNRARHLCYLLFFPLSFLFPEFVKVWFIEFSPPDDLDEWRQLYSPRKMLLLNFLAIVIIAPVLEEFFFRGILLTRWTVKWSIIPACHCVIRIVFFALLHTNLIGSSVMLRC